MDSKLIDSESKSRAYSPAMSPPHGTERALDGAAAAVHAQVEQGVNTARSALNDTAASLRHRANHALTAGDSYVRDRPWQSIGIAAMTGLVIGLLVRRR